ncbi:MAG: DUF1501 domain-containing protein [Gemmataceae bacterium]|nr:DUF1501 domain-containing protein [Gemmataceae bacterium]MDW8267358.1 DUF1501 domain-containing protein [Gemmataceae bacterium]
MHPISAYIQAMTRRHFFRRAGLGLGAAALAVLGPPRAKANGRQPPSPHHPPRAQRAIFLFMNGGPSQLDLWDYKPQMANWFGKDLPDSVRDGQRLTLMTANQQRLLIAPSIYRFARHGRSGTWVSELLPWTARVVDELCVIKSLQTDEINHDPAVTFLCTGHAIPGRASLGAWVSYGLGSENANLPTFVVMTPVGAEKLGNGLTARLWGAGFLPGRHQGVLLRAQGEPLLFLSNPAGVDASTRRRMLDSLAHLNEKHFAEVGDPETLTRIAQYELAFRMQMSVPQLVDLSREPAHVRALYGPDVDRPGTFAASCLLARRLVEQGVRFVQIFHRGWDNHLNLPRRLPIQCQESDQPCYGLITDLKQRGLLEETLVIWAGEFGRTIFCQGTLTPRQYGREHHPRCAAAWLAGGGIRPGITHGETDDFSFNVVRDPVHVHDLHATILHCLGIDHERLTYRYQGLDVRLTGVEPRQPVWPILL